MCKYTCCIFPSEPARGKYHRECRSIEKADKRKASWMRLLAHELFTPSKDYDLQRGKERCPI